ncbi:hypothetical protein RAK27_08555 [Carnobacterium maltaromaticum]|uniref:Phage protein n=1 Tax=Carnobacterium maltaromaticum TaxID=2751 RepID=A0AAW9K5P7_CARML|nr:hypothetical protein [Carnobacterium maltaromaticum]MDZ5758702.1 hypothetical protein [Carnobacterium maltaromaticum]
MWISLSELLTIVKSLGLPVFRNNAPKNTDYPYYVYSYVGQTDKKASGKIFKSLPLYQISLYTAGTEKDLKPIISKLDEYRIPFKGFRPIQGDENDATITNFFTYVRCVEDVTK